MASTYNNVLIKKTRADSFPSIVPVVLLSVVSLSIKCTGANGVKYEFITSGDTGEILPGETKEVFTNSEPVSDTIDFTFDGAANIEVIYSIGAGSASGSTIIADLLTKKNYNFCVLDLAAPAFGSFPGFPAVVKELMLEYQGIAGNSYQYSSNAVRDTTELATVLNRYQKFSVFEAKSATELYIKEGLYPSRGLNELEILFSTGSANYTVFAYNVGNLPTSWGDCLLQNLMELNGIVRNLSATEVCIHGVFDSVLSLANTKYCSFFVLNGTVDVLVGGYNTLAVAVEFPIIGANGTLLGTTYQFTSPAVDVAFSNFSVGAQVYVQYTLY